MTRLVERFLKYVAVDTQSDPTSETYPTTAKQFDLAKIVQEEMVAMGLSQVDLDEHCYLTATLPSNVDKEVPVMGLCAHFDTSPDYSGADVKPIIHKAYAGGALTINETTVLDPKEFAFLNKHIGHDIITTDGTTLLGADNKAGVAEIMELLNYLVEHPEVKHGEIKVMFTPDEEVGRGTDKANLDKFKVEFAYTVDGGEIGELEYENFNAASLQVKINGLNIHPGSAKDKMVNAVLIGMEYHHMLPQNQAPQHTEGYEGFYHLNDFNGSVEHASLFYIIRDHDLEAFEDKKRLAQEAAAYINKKYGENTLEISLTDSYFNMREKIEPVMYIVDHAKLAMERVGVSPSIKPIRGGTDGARLSFMGIPTPNIFTGGYNFHGRFELIPIQSMEKALDVLVELVKIIEEKA